MTKDDIENRRAFLRGITAPDGWVNELCDLALKGLEPRPEGTAFKEIGRLHRTREGEVHFIQKDAAMEFPLHSFITIYGKDDTSKPQPSDA